LIHNQFTSKIIKWYDLNKRDLPWRNTKNPYFIWISEIILQQTRVSQGLPYYEKFVQAFPTVEALALAKEQEVLSLWQGLGYYSRARNMHACAQTVVDSFDSNFPDEFQQLLTLSGIGPYTAAAIASLAFEKATPVVDGNVYRVIARVFGIENNIAETKSFKLFYDLSLELIDTQQPGTYNQAVMEMGATICAPQNPQCDSCPLEEICFARKNKKQKELPVKIKKIRNRIRYFTYLVIELNDKIAMSQRNGKDIWQGLFEFYLIENKSSKRIDELEDGLLQKLMDEGETIVQEMSMPKHILSHQTIFSTFLKIKINEEPKWANMLNENKLVLYSQPEIEALPKSVLISKYLNSVS
jgi:A/G-specific adenine glycosylase